MPAFRLKTKPAFGLSRLQLFCTVAIIGLLVGGVLLIFEHFIGKSKLAAVRSQMTKRGQSAELKQLLTAPPANLMAFTNQFERTVAKLFKTPLYGSSALLSVAPGKAARGSQAPRPMASDPKNVSITNSVALQRHVTNTWDFMEHGFAESAPALETVRNLLRNPPAITGTDFVKATREMRLPNYASIRTAAQNLADATTVHLHARNLPEAEQDLLALVGCVQFNRNHPTLVGQMIRVAIEGLAATALWDAIQDKGWSDEQLARIQHAWEIEPMPPKVAAALHGERLARVELYEGFRSTTYLQWQTKCVAILNGFGARAVTPPRIVQLWNHYVFKPTWNFAWADHEEALSLQSSSFLTEQLEGGVKKHSLANIPWDFTPAYHFAAWRFYFKVPIAEKMSEIMGPSRAGVPNVQTASLLSHLAATFASSPDFSPPNFSRAIERAAINDNLRQMAITALALKRYKLRNNIFPEELSALTPEFLKEVPLDWFDGKPLRYRVNPDADYTLYSVGIDGHDDNGDATPLEPNSWSGSRDEVWHAEVSWGQN